MAPEGVNIASARQLALNIDLAFMLSYNTYRHALVKLGFKYREDP